jgi:hypothetical protein
MKLIDLFESGLFESLDYSGMDPYEFDQTRNGWRGIGNKISQINTLHNYISKNIKQNKFVNFPEAKLDPSTLYWHLGQLYAMIDNYDKAIHWMKLSLSYTDPQWQNYVNATIAFLNNNKDLFLKYYKPPNSNKPTLDRLYKNWAKPYKVAY